MATIFGALNLSDSDRVFNATQGQAVVFDAVQAYVNAVNSELELSASIFVERSTDAYKNRYYLPGGGTLQKMGTDGRPGAVKAVGSWDVAFPLEEYGAQLAGGKVAMAYLTVAELDRHVQNVALQNAKTVRFEMLKRLFNNVQTSFPDPQWGTLLIEPLANGDTVTFPPIAGADDAATENHYLGSAYAASSISDTNNPFITIRDELEEHQQSGGASNIAVFINTAQVTKAELLTDYDPMVERFIQVGANTDVPINAPTNLPGRVIARTNGVWVVEWKQIPANYMLGLDLDAPKPLIKRIDPADTGLPEGLQLVADKETQYPFQASFWRHRFGFGAGNRLNGVVMDMSNTDSDYDIPSAYA